MKYLYCKNIPVLIKASALSLIQTLPARSIQAPSILAATVSPAVPIPAEPVHTEGLVLYTLIDVQTNSSLGIKFESHWTCTN